MPSAPRYVLTNSDGSITILENWVSGEAADVPLAGTSGGGGYGPKPKDKEQDAPPEGGVITGEPSPQEAANSPPGSQIPSLAASAAGSPTMVPESPEMGPILKELTTHPMGLGKSTATAGIVTSLPCVPACRAARSVLSFVSWDGHGRTARRVPCASWCVLSRVCPGPPLQGGVCERARAVPRVLLAVAAAAGRTPSCLLLPHPTGGCCWRRSLEASERTMSSAALARAALAEASSCLAEAETRLAEEAQEEATAAAEEDDMLRAILDDVLEDAAWIEEDEEEEEDG